MKLEKWEDGFVLDADPRREDPLYYYMRDGAWGSGIGVRVDPLYEEHKAANVTLSIFSEHLAREAGMDAAERLKMYHRIVSVLLGRFPKWSRVTLQSSYLPEIMVQDLVSAAFTSAGFLQSASTTPNEQTWTKS